MKLERWNVFPVFRDKLIDILDGSNTVIGSISLKGGAFIQQIKKRKDIELVQISERNRNRLVVEFFER